MWTPNASRMSALPHWLDIDRLPCLATFTPAPAMTKAATVETLNVQEPSPPVPQVSSSGSSVNPGLPSHPFTRIARAKPTSSSAVSPFIRSATRKPAICAVVACHRLRISSITTCASAEVRFSRFTALWRYGNERHAIVNAWLPCQTSTRSVPTSCG